MNRLNNLVKTGATSTLMLLTMLVEYSATCKRSLN